MSAPAPDIFQLSEHPCTIASLADGQLTAVAACLAGYGPTWRDVVISEILTRFWLYRANPTAALAPACNALPESLRDFVREKLPNQLEPQTDISSDLLPRDTTGRCWHLFAERGRIFHRAHGFLLLLAPKESDGGVIVPYKMHSVPGAWDYSGQEIPVWSECLAMLDAHLPSRPGIKISADIAGRTDLMLGASLMLPVFLSAKAATHSFPQISPFHLLATGEFTENGLASVAGMFAKREMAEKIGAFLLAPRQNGVSNAFSLKCGISASEILSASDVIIKKVKLPDLSPRERFDNTLMAIPFPVHPTKIKHMTAATIFQRVSDEAQTTVNNWNYLRSIITHAAEKEGDTMTIEELNEIDAQLQDGLRDLQKALNEPELVLAVAGTTSSGKSMLLNALIGRKLLPSSVKAKTAGVTEIVHSESPWMQIENSDISPPKTESLSDDEIYCTIDAVMEEFNAKKLNEIPPTPPKITLGYPLKRLRAPEHLQIADFIKIRLLDLPGRESLNDVINANVIRGGTRQALCCVVYNASNTDNELRRRLLEEVTQQVKELGGSPARMLFILNRIDDFRKDDNWNLQQQLEIVAELTVAIRQELHRSLDGYSSDIDELRVVPFSSEPALLAQFLLSDDDAIVNYAIKRAETFYRSMIPEDLYYRLPRNLKDSNPAQRRELAHALSEASGVSSFVTHLRSHICTHLPELVIPAALDRFWVNQGKLARSIAINITSAKIAAASDDYESKVAEINEMETAIIGLLRRFNSEFSAVFAPLEKAKSSEDIIRKVWPDCEKRGRELPYSSPTLENEFEKLRGWTKNFPEESSKILACVVDAFRSEHHNESAFDNLTFFPEREKRQLLEKIRFMRNTLGYKGKKAEEGFWVEAKTEDQQRQIEIFQHELAELAGKVSQALNCVQKNNFRREVKNMREALGAIFRAYHEYCEAEAHKTSKDIYLTLPKTPDPEEPESSFNYSFAANVDATKFTYEISVEHWVPRHGIDWLFHFGKHKKVISQEKRDGKKAYIPGVISHLALEWTTELLKENMCVMNQFSVWLTGLIGSGCQEVERSVTCDIEKYREFLLRAKNLQKDTFEKIKDRWQPIREKALEWALEEQGVGGGLCPTESLFGTWEAGKSDALRVMADGTWHRETSAKVSCGNWEFQAPLLWLTSTDTGVKEAWFALAGSHLWPKSNVSTKFRKRPEANDEK